jgi:hypothetical protein
MAEKKKKPNDPVRWSPEIEDEFCKRIMEGRSVNSIAGDDDMPNGNTFWRWMGEKETLRTKYAHAIEARALAQADEIADLTRRVVRGEVPPDVARVALDGLKWTASRLLPKVYGDRQSVDVSVTHMHQLHLDALKRLNENAAPALPSNIIEGEIVGASE